MTLAELQRIYEQPLFTLIQQARNVYLEHWKVDQVQLCTLLSIKTGGCSEDCGYCSQSARSGGSVKAGKLLENEEILLKAREASANGSTRFCMGAAWRGVRDGDPRFEQVLGTIREVSKLGMEVCVTLGHLTLTEASKLKEAGVTAYNHNIDTSPEFYDQIISTRTFQDRLDTLDKVRQSGVKVCSGGILGLGETNTDRIAMLIALANLDEPPESVPINKLIKIPGTPLANQTDVDCFDFVRTIALARIIMPKTMVRLSAGREQMSDELQALCFLAGANSIFYGEKLLTAANPVPEQDHSLFQRLGLQKMKLSECAISG